MTIPFVVLAAIVAMGWRLRALEANAERDRWNAPPPKKNQYRDDGKGAERHRERLRLCNLIAAETPGSPEWKRLHLQLALV